LWWLAAAAIYSLLGSAKLNGIDPEVYMVEVLRRIADHPINRIGELLPWNLFPAVPAKLEAAWHSKPPQSKSCPQSGSRGHDSKWGRDCADNLATARIEDVHVGLDDADKQILYLRFRKTGDVYRYFEFPVTEYSAFLDAESRGRFFLAHIRDRLRFERMAKLKAA
jgi:hypothetical protein